MTNTEIIEGLKAVRIIHNGNYAPFIDGAIKVLSAESCDCISRQAVIDAFWKLNVELRPNAIDAILNMVNDMPSVTPKPKTGHWIFAEGIKGKDNVEKCSYCGSRWKEAIIYRTDTQEYLRTRLLHCPNCGAKMESEGKE